MKSFVLTSLRFYKRFISPLLGQRCRFYPTCSEYMYTAVVRHGTIRGVYMGLKRLIKCQPCTRGGYDPVP